MDQNVVMETHLDIRCRQLTCGDAAFPSFRVLADLQARMRTDAIWLETTRACGFEAAAPSRETTPTPRHVP